MSKRLSLVIFTLTGGLILTSYAVRAEQQSGAIYLAAESALENTARNLRDKDSITLTPLDQSETDADIKITTAIRQAVVKDESLSVNAQNIKIITRNGIVTLRGPVETRAESKKIQQIAQQSSGVAKVESQLENKAP